MANNFSTGSAASDLIDLNGLFSSNSAYNARLAPLDSGTSDLIDQRSNQSIRGEPAYADSTLENVNRGSGFLSTPDQMQRQQYSLGMGSDAAMNGAIQNKANKYYNSAINDVSRKATTQAPITKSNNMASAQGMLNNYQDIQFGMEQRQYESEQNKIAARNAAIRSIFSSVGSVVGGMYGGAAGSAVGGQAGNAAGPKSNYQGVAAAPGSSSTSGSSVGDFNSDSFPTYV